jgi:hypothetical protein
MLNLSIHTVSHRSALAESFATELPTYMESNL